MEEEETVKVPENRERRDQEREMEKKKERKEKRTEKKRKRNELETRSFNHLTFIVIKTYCVPGTMPLCLGLEIEMSKTHRGLQTNEG